MAGAGLVCNVEGCRPLRLQAPQIEALAHFTRVELAPLSEAEAAQAIRAKLAQLLPERKGAATPALIPRITAKAQGNLFYAEEPLNSLRARGIDPQDSAGLLALWLLNQSIFLCEPRGTRRQP